MGVMLRTPALLRFFRYALVGVSTLAFDLLLLVALTEYVHIPYYVSTPLAFLVAVSINYALSRAFVFAGTERALYNGYAYFLLGAGAGALIITASVAFLVTYAGMPYLVARIFVAGFVGIANYLFNLYVNFRVVGKH